MTLSRRDLLALAATTPGLAWLPKMRPVQQRSLGAAAPPLPNSPGPDDEAEWQRIAREFLIEGVHLNTGTYGAMPMSVLEATARHLRAFERITRQEGVDRIALHTALEEFLGAWPGSVAVVRNTTEAMNIVAAGIGIAAGDEIVTTTHEHIGGLSCWELAAKRHGAVLKTFTPPLDPGHEDELTAAWLAEVTPRTRVWSISHVLFTTGLKQPVARLVQLARERGIVTVIDGAHPPGMLAFDIRQIDADFYASSPHKWLLAPKGTGLLVTRPDRIASTWPLIASGEWDVADVRKFEHVGTGNDSLLAGLAAAVAFHQKIGREAIEARVRWLATRLDAALRATPGVRVVSPGSAAFRTAMVSCTVSGRTGPELQRELGRDRFRTRVIAEHGLDYLRLSTHIYVLPQDLDRVVERLAALAR